MRAVVQRVIRASVTSDAANGAVVGEIGPGLCVLVGVNNDDAEAQARKLADKLWGLRILDDEHGVMNRSANDRHEAGEPVGLLVISQFTLYGDTSRGRRPSWIAAARPERAEPLVDLVARRLIELGAIVATGRFGTHMEVALVNDGPVTVIIDV